MQPSRSTCATNITLVSYFLSLSGVDLILTQWSTLIENLAKKSTSLFFLESILYCSKFRRRKFIYFRKPLSQIIVAISPLFISEFLFHYISTVGFNRVILKIRTLINSSRNNEFLNYRSYFIVFLNIFA